MVPVVALLVISAVSFIIIRVGTLALTMTGLGQDAASFQAVSAFFGVGFTTREAELVVNHPVRRRIIRDLIVIGNIGLTGVLATVIAAVVSMDFTHPVFVMKLGVLVCGLLVFALLWRLGIVRRLVDRTIRVSLERAGMLRALDYEMLLRVRSGFAVSEFDVEPKSPLAGKTLGELKLRSVGVIVLGIVRPDGTYVGGPHGDSMIEAGDVLVVYGTDDAVKAVVDPVRAAA